jgi:hypothetical protein
VEVSTAVRRSRFQCAAYPQVGTDPADAVTNEIIAGTRHPFTCPILGQSGAEKMGTGLTVPDQDLAKMNGYVQAEQA